MHVFLIDAFPAGSIDSVIVDEAVATLESNGHNITRRELVGGPFETFMSAAEREAYHGDTPLVTPETREDAEVLGRTDALLFCYPTTLFMTPGVLKSWLERVLVPGVAFVFDDNEKVKPGMTNIRRLGAITTTPHSGALTRRARDAGRRTTQRNLRLSCHSLCRRTFVSLDAGSADVVKVRRALSKW